MEEVKRVANSVASSFCYFLMFSDSSVRSFHLLHLQVSQAGYGDPVC